MRLLNDHKGNANGKVHLTLEDVGMIKTALFYLQHEEPHADHRHYIGELKQQFEALEKLMNDHEN